MLCRLFWSQRLYDHLMASNANDDVRCIVITGTGRRFARVRISKARRGNCLRAVTERCHTTTF